MVLRWHRLQQQDIEYIVSQYPHETVVDVSGEISDDDAVAIAGIARLERLNCSWPTLSSGLSRLVAGLQHHPGLQEVVLDGRSRTAFDDAELDQLATIPQLRSLAIVGDCSRVTETRNRRAGELRQS